MARIRSIRPEWPLEHARLDLSRDVRLHWLLLLTITDDHGRGDDDPRVVHGALWVLDDDVTPTTINTWHDELADAGLLLRYDVDGRSYYEIANWSEHQKPQHRAKSTIPPPPDPSPEPGEGLRQIGGGDHPNRVLGEGVGGTSRVTSDEGLHRSLLDLCTGYHGRKKSDAPTDTAAAIGLLRTAATQRRIPSDTIDDAISDAITTTHATGARFTWAREAIDAITAHLEPHATVTAARPPCTVCDDRGVIELPDGTCADCTACKQAA